MHRLLNGGRPAANMNKPLPEPLVDPDEGKTPIGELVIIPIQGKDLPNRERFGKQDPFILFKLGNVSKRSSTDVRGGQRPVWKDDQINIFMYESDAKDAKSLYVTCLDEDPKKNDLIGDCVINLAKVLEQGEHDDWFELSYKGREAGLLMLQLTYYSHDPKHPTNKMNRTSSTPVAGAAARRPIHPAKDGKKPEETQAADEHTDEGPVYKPPVVPEAPAASVYQDPIVPAQVPMVSAAGYPYGTLPTGAGRPVSPSGQNHYVGHHTPVVPPVNPYGQPAAPANPYAVNNAYPGYPTAAAPGYPDPSLGADPSKRLSFTGQPPVQPGGFPAAGYPANQGYPAQAPGQQTGFPPQTGGFPPQVNNAFPAPGGGYPPATAVPNTPFPAAHSLPNSQVGGGGPPAGYPFAASNIYPPNTSNSGINTSGPGFPGQTPPQGFPQGGPGFLGPANNSGNGNNANYNGGFPGNNNNGPYNNAGGINNHSNGNVNNMNQNNFNNNHNNGAGFNNSGNGHNASGFNNNGNNGFNGGNNNFNGGNNFNNGGGFNQNNNNNGGGNFNNNGGNFNHNNNGGNFNNHGNNGSGFNNNNNNNNGSNNGSSFGSNGSSHNSGHNHSYSNSGNPGAYPVATPKKHNTISPTPIVATPVTPNRTVGGSMYGPDEF
ncbi:unnamed protein product [Mortierella alpina]